MRESLRLRRFACLLALSIALPFAAGERRAFAASSAEESKPTVVAHADVWAKSAKLVREGDSAQARLLLDELVARSSDPQRARTWVTDWLEQEQARRGLTQAEYEDYVARAKKWMDQQKNTRALKWTYLAMLDTFKSKDFQKQDWVLRLREQALAEGDKLYAEKNWRDAHAIYYSLNLIFEDDKDIDKKRKDCLEHARLDEIYKVEREWQDDLEGVHERMVEEAFYRIDRKYVEEADFKAMTVAGYEELLLIAESPTLQGQFDGLTGDRGKEFTNAVRKRLQQVRGQDTLTFRDALNYFRRALEINSESAKLPQALLVKEYTNAALQPLDEFTSVIWPSEFREFEKHTRGDFIGVGIQIRNKYNPEIKETEIVVVSPLEDTPAYRAGIQAEDIITHVNGESMVGVPVTKAVAKITGPMNTAVTLSIRRPNEQGEQQTTDYKLVRDMVRIQSVKSMTRIPNDEEHWNFIMDDDLGIGYVRVNSFQENTVIQLDAALRAATQRGMRGLILDLRYNPGGLLKSAVEMAELFLPRKSAIVSTRGLRSEEWPVVSEIQGPYAELPLIVLINEGSASASEIVSGAIQDHKRGLIIGDRSFGKFSVQNLIRLVHSEAHLKLTTARYYLPSGRSLHRDDDASEWGVSPDIAIPLVPKEESKIIFMRRDADVIGAVKTRSEEEVNEPLKPRSNDEDSDEAEVEEEEDEPDPNNWPNRDPQLDTALLVMRLYVLAEDPVRMATRAANPVTPQNIANE